MKRLFTLILMLCLVGAAHAQPTTPKYGENIPTGAVLGYYPATGKFYVLPVNASGSLIVDAGVIGGDYLEVDGFGTLVAKDDRSFQAVSFLIGGADALTASGTDWIALGGSAYARTDLFGSLYLNEYILAKNNATNWRLFSDQSTSTITGAHNYFIGDLAGTANTSGGYNVALGYRALSGNTTGSQNVALGYDTLRSLIGSGNIAIGYSAGAQMASSSYNSTMTRGIFIGSNSKSAANASTDEIVIGHNVDGHGDNTVTIGNMSNTMNYFTGNQNLSDVPEYADNAAASAGGLASGTFYHTAGVLKIVY